MSRKLASIITAVAIAAASIGSACAESGYKTSSVTVSYGDLDLTKTEGVDTLTSRLNRAVNRVCGRAVSASTTINRHIRACRQQATETAVASINAPLLTAQYQGRRTTPRV